MRALIVTTLLLPASVFAQAIVNVPQVTGYQGRLLKADGTPVNGPADPGQVNIIFRLYDQEVGGTLKWNETQKVVLTNGFYAVFLGSEDPKKPKEEPKLVDALNGHPRWLELQIEGDSMPLTPRQLIGSVAYAFRSAHATSADTAANVSGGGTVSAMGGTFTGPVTVPTPTKPEHAATMHYVNELPARASTWSAAQAMSGGVTGLPEPRAPSDAATKEYVDSSSFLVAFRLERNSNGIVVRAQKGHGEVSFESWGTSNIDLRVPGLTAGGVVTCSADNSWFLSAQALNGGVLRVYTQQQSVPCSGIESFSCIVVP
jgi:hypothetical protein